MGFHPLSTVERTLDFRIFNTLHVAQYFSFLRFDSEKVMDFNLWLYSELVENDETQIVFVGNLQHCMGQVVTGRHLLRIVSFPSSRTALQTVLF